MKKRSFVVAAFGLIANSALGFAAPANASGGQTFSSYGACYAAIVRVRNDIRQVPGQFDNQVTSDYNAHVRYHYECVEIDRNVWVIMRV
jgi:hypothetical protein